MPLFLSRPFHCLQSLHQLGTHDPFVIAVDLSIVSPICQSEPPAVLALGSFWYVLQFIRKAVGILPVRRFRGPGSGQVEKFCEAIGRNRVFGCSAMSLQHRQLKRRHSRASSKDRRPVLFACRNGGGVGEVIQESLLSPKEKGPTRRVAHSTDNNQS